MSLKVERSTEMRYEIPVENIEKLRKKATQIQKKAVKYGVQVKYEELEEIVKEVVVETEYGEPAFTEYRRFVVVEVEGEAKAEGWEFVGTIEHTEQGNIMRSVSDEHKIPERYKNATPYCEHCKTRRARKDTYVVFNEETGEFKQVGKTCLKEYTKGLSAEMVAFLLQWLDEFEKGEYHVTSGGRPEYKVSEISKYFVETMHKLGWASSQREDSTKRVAMDFYKLFNTNHFSRREREVLQAKADSINFDVKNVSDEYISEALEWARSWDEHEYNDYRQNLKVIANMEFVDWKHLGYLASLFMAYDKEMEREVKRAEKAASKANSQHVAKVGDKVTANVKSAKLLTGWETQWGITYLYEFITEDGNVLVWKTGKSLDLEDVAKVSGTVKAHNEYNGVKQTELTRCKVEAPKPTKEEIAKAQAETKEAFRVFFEATA